MRKPIIVGNWKMHKTNAEAEAFMKAVEPAVGDWADFGVAAPFTALEHTKKLSNKLIVAAQNVHEEANGAFTGEVSIPMLQEIGIDWVIIGHSERRQYFGETDESVHKKLAVLLAQGMHPIVCVGETLAQFEAGKTEEVVRNQVLKALEGLSSEAVSQVVIAYEPIWAIGTGKSANTEIAQNTCALIRKAVRDVFGDAADQLRIQYGGSVKPENIKEYLAQPDIDGALIGGASLKADSFTAIIDAVH